MKNSYKSMMEGITLSRDAETAFREKMEQTQPRRRTSRMLRAALIAACLCIAVPMTVLAVDTVFGLGIIHVGERPDPFTNEEGVGYDVSFDGVANLPVETFAEKWRSMQGSKTVVYASWEDAVEDIGLPMPTNTVLSQNYEKLDGLYYEPMTGNEENAVDAVHCYADYNGRDGQLYSATISAAYWHDNITVNIRAKATASHPTYPAEQLLNLHKTYSTYGDDTDISVEEYTAPSGLTVAFARIQEKGYDYYYRADFTANGISYQVWMSDCDYSSTVKDARAEFIRILDGFTF